MSEFKCTKELYKAFLQASSVRYSGLALSEVSPTELSHDSISRWLRNKCFRPREIWRISEQYIYLSYLKMRSYEKKVSKYVKNRKWKNYQN